jgi:PAS domain S-box-containing protein
MNHGEAKFQEMMNNLDIGYFRGEFEGKLVMHNIAVNKILGIDLSIDLTGSKVSQFFTNPETQRQYYKELRKNECVKNFIAKIRKSDEEILYLQINSQLIKEDNQTFVEGTVVDITEKFKLEQSLKETEKQFKMIASNSNDLISILDENFKHIFINEPAYYNILGYKKEEILGKRPREFTHPEDLKRAVNAIKKGLIKGEISEKFRIKHKDGHYVWVESKGKYIKQDKIFVGAIFTNRDITKSMESEQKLKESEQKYKILFDSSPDALILIGMNGKVLDCNLSSEKLSGFNRSDLVGKNFNDIAFIPKKFITVVLEDFKTLLKGEPLKPREIQLFKKDKSLAWVLYQCSIVKLNDQQLVQIIIRDNTEIKNTEQKLIESEAKYRLITENANDLIAVLDTGLKYKFVNKGYELLGYSKEEIFSGLPTDLIHPDDVKNAIRAFRNGLKDGIGLEELRVKHKDGHYSWFEVKGKTFQDANGVLNALLISRDITERKNVEKKQKEVNVIKSEFLRRASHELKTPLISIKGFSDLILNLYGDKLDTNITSKLNEINLGCERLQSIINDLLKASRLESPELRPEKHLENLTFLIKYCIDELHPLAAKREHLFNLKVHDTIITMLEKEEIHDVLINLLSNAIKYTPPRGLIEVSSENVDDFVVISIADNGIGFTDDEKEKIFQQFGKIERYGQGLDLGIDGTGLGLYISKKIVESHGGKIWMESDGKNKGSTFSFSLPIINE